MLVHIVQVATLAGINQHNPMAPRSLNMAMAIHHCRSRGGCGPTQISGRVWAPGVPHT